MSPAILKEVASQFSISEDKLLEEGIKAFLQDKLHLMEVERQQIFRKFGVNSFKELDQYITDRPDEESDLLEDFERADYLTFRIEQIQKLFKQRRFRNKPVQQGRAFDWMLPKKIFILMMTLD